MEIVKPDFQKALQALRRGMVLVCPTDTVYGLVCDAANKKAIARIYLIKKRPKSKPLPIFVRSIAMAKTLAKINKKQEDFLKEVWPGDVTVILQKKRGVGKIGIRIPNFPWLLSLAEQLGRPLAETSANISGKPSTTKIKEVLKYFKGRRYQPDLVLDAGDLKSSGPSKVIDLISLPPKILRN